MKVSEYLARFRPLSYSELFSAECLSGLEIIQDKYGQADSDYVVYEVNLKEPSRTLDFSYRFHEEIPAYHYWYEFDHKFYSKGNLSHCYFLDRTDSDFSLSEKICENEEAICRVTGREKFEVLRQPLNDLEKFLTDRGLRISYLGSMDNRGYSESVRIETRVRTCRRLVELIRDISYSGDVSLIEDTISKIEPYAARYAYLFSFDLFADRISDKIGVAFFPFSSVKDTENTINFLTANNLCLHEKGQGLMKWAGDPVPEGLLQHRINFIKIQFEKNNIVAVKAYLMQSDELPLKVLLLREREQ